MGIVDGVSVNRRVLVILLALAAIVSSAAPAAGSLVSSEPSHDRGGTADTTARNGPWATIHPTVQRRMSDSDTQRVLLLLQGLSEISSLERQGDIAAVDALKRRAERRQEPVVDRLAMLREGGAVGEYRSLWLVNAIVVEGATERAVRQLSKLPSVEAIVPDRAISLPARPPNQVDPTSLTEHISSVRGDHQAWNGSVAHQRRVGAIRRLRDSPLPVPPVGSLRTESSSIGSSQINQSGLAEVRLDGGSANFAWGITRMGVPAAWDRGIDGSGVSVAVIDTGVDSDHPALQDDLEKGRAFVPCDRRSAVCDTPWDDDHGHGTHVAGIITAPRGTGVAPNASVIPVKVLGSGGAGYMSTIVQGIQYAVEVDADIVSISLGGPGSSILRTALSRATELGTIPVVSVGNFARSTTDSDFILDLRDWLAVGNQPGSYRGVISVGAISRRGAVSYFSAHDILTDGQGNYTKPDVTAPGEQINSTAPNGGFEVRSGTSMAAPHVSGLVALLLQVNASLETAEVKELLAETSRDIYKPGADVKTGAGRADVRAVHRLLRGNRTLILSTNKTRSAPGSGLRVVVRVVDDTGHPISNETVDIVVMDAPPRFQYLLGTSIVNTTVTTNASGIATTVVNLASNRTGTWTINAFASDGMVHAVMPIAVTATNVSVRLLNASRPITNGDNVTAAFSISRNGTPVNATVKASMMGPTLHAYGPLVRTTRTGPDGVARITFRIPENPLFGVYTGFAYGQAPGASWGEYTIVAQFENASTVLTRRAVAGNVTTVEQGWTNVEFGDEKPWTFTLFGGPLADLYTYNGQYAAGESFRYRLSTTRSNASYEISLRHTSRNGSWTTTVLDRVRTDSQGTANGTVVLPQTLPTQLAYVVTKPTGVPDRDVSVGEFDVSFIGIERADLTISVKGKNEPNQAFEPGETVTATVIATAPGSTERINLSSLRLNVTWTENATENATGTRKKANLTADLSRVAPGIYRATWTIPPAVTGGFGRFAFRAVARSYPEGGPPTIARWSGVATEYAISIVRDRSIYRPGSLVTHFVRVADPETGLPMANVTVRLTAVVGFRSGTGFLEPLTVTRTAHTDAAGVAVVTYALRNDSVFSRRNSRVIVNVTGDDSVGYRSTTVPVEGAWPSLHVRSVNATAQTRETTGHALGDRIGAVTTTRSEIALSGQETLTFRLDLDRYDPTDNGVDKANEPVDIVILDTDGGIVDYRASDFTNVVFDDDGTRVVEHEVTPEDEPGTVYVIAFVENRSFVLSARTFTYHDSTGGLRIRTNGRNATAGKLLNITVDGLSRTGWARAFLIPADVSSSAWYSPVYGDVSSKHPSDTVLKAFQTEAPRRFLGKGTFGMFQRRGIQDLVAAIRSQSVQSSVPFISSIVPNSDGETVTIPIRIPANAPDGRYRVVVVGANESTNTPSRSPLRVGVASIDVRGGVVPNAKASATGYTLSTRTIGLDETLRINVSVVNPGPIKATTNVTVYVDSQPITNRSVTVPGGDITFPTFTTTFSSTGRHTIRIGDLHATTVVVGSRTDMYVTEAAGQPGETAQVVLRVPDSSNLSAFRANITFDPTMARVADVTTLGSQNARILIDNDAGWLSIRTNSERRIDPILARITFRIVGTVGDVSSLSLIEDDSWVMDTDDNRLPVRPHDGRLSVADAVISLGDVSTSPNDSVSVVLSADVAATYGFDANFTFDPDVIRVRNVSSLAIDQLATSVDNDAGFVSISAAAADSVGPDPDLAVITFDVVANGSVTSPLSFVRTDTNLYDASGQPLPIGYTDGLVTVRRCATGDANGDGNINAGDVVVVLRYSAGLIDVLPGETPLSCADANGDGMVNAGDGIVLLRRSAGSFAR